MTENQLELIPGTYFGCDPELFLTQDGGVVGAEKFMSPMDVEKFSKVKDYTCTRSYLDKFSLDGVQLELNPSPNPCRANLANEMRAAFIALKARLKETGTVQACFNTVVEIDQKELDSLSEQAKVFGCAKSYNSYDKAAKVTANAATYLKRTAGGHIHLGLPDHLKVDGVRERLIPILDIVLGNTCVMIDRDPYASERRKNYGRAGEYRLPKHGIEYRTLSNFWLRSYQLMSLVMGLARVGVWILGQDIAYIDKYGNKNSHIPWNAEKELLDSIDLEAVRRAINDNDLQLAQENYKAVRSFIEKHLNSSSYYAYAIPLAAQTINAFDYFCKMVQEKGIEYWFPLDPLEHWTSMPEGHGTGWETFLEDRVTRAYMADLESRISAKG